MAKRQLVATDIKGILKVLQSDDIDDILSLSRRRELSNAAEQLDEHTRAYVQYGRRYAAQSTEDACGDGRRESGSTTIAMHLPSFIGSMHLALGLSALSTRAEATAALHRAEVRSRSFPPPLALIEHARDCTDPCAGACSRGGRSSTPRRRPLCWCSGVRYTDYCVDQPRRTRQQLPVHTRCGSDSCRAIISRCARPHHMAPVGRTPSVSQ